MPTRFFTTGTLAIAMLSSMLISSAVFADETPPQQPDFLEAVIADSAGDETDEAEKAEAEKALEESESAAEEPAAMVLDTAIPAFTEDTKAEEAANSPAEFDFTKIKLRPLVKEEAPPNPAPPEVQKKFQDEMAALEKLVGDKMTDAAITAARKIIDDFSSYDFLVRAVKKRLASLLLMDPSRALEAIELYDELISMDGFPSVAVSQFLANKQSLLERRREYDDANRTIMRRLEQPDLTDAQRDDLKVMLVRNLIQKQDYDKAKEIALPLVEDETITPVARVQIATLIGEYMRIYKKDTALEIRVLLKVKDIPLEKKHEWIKFDRAHHLAFMYLADNLDEKGPQYDKAMEVLKEVYDDETLSFEPRWQAFRSLLNLRNQQPQDPDPAALIEETNRFMEANKDKLTEAQRDAIELFCLDTYIRRNIDTPEGQKLADSIAMDAERPARKRVEAACYHGKHLAKEGDNEKAEEYFRIALPLTKDIPYMVHQVLQLIAGLYSPETDRAKIIDIYNEGTALNDSEEMARLVENAIKNVPAAPQPAPAPAAE